MKRKLSIAVSVAMSLAVILSACSGSGSKAGESSAPPSSGSSAAPTDSAAPTNAEGTDGGKVFPLKDKVTLKAVTARPPLAPSDFNTQPLMKQIEQDTNVHIDWDTIVETDYNEKKNLLLASGNLPDLFFGSRFADTELIKYGKNGTIIPLNDLIDKHMPNLKAIFEKRPDIKAMVTAPDGNIYSLPIGEEMGSGQEEIGANPDFLYINQDWLDKLHLQMPTTMDEYTAVLKAFKTGDPNGNGKADEIPLTYIDNFWTGDIGVLFGAFGVPDKTYRPNNPTFIDHLNVDNGVVTYAPTQPGYKDAAAYIHNWFKDGLVDVEAFTHDYDTYFARGKTKDETIGSLIWWDKNDVVGQDRGTHWKIVPPFKGMVVKWNNGASLGRAGSVITKENKNPEVTAAWLDLMYEPTMAAQIRFGPIGVWFDKDANGKLIQKKVENPGETRQSTAVSNGIGLLLASDLDKVDYMEPRAAERVKDSVQYFVPQMQKEKFPDIFFTEEELKTIERLKKPISDYTNKTRAKWLLKGGVENEWDDFQATLKKMGIEELIKVHQDAYNRYLAAQK